MPDNELMLKVKGDTSDAKKKLEDLGKTLGVSKSQVGSVAAAFTTSGAAIAAGAFLNDSINKAKEQQVETAKLGVAIRNTGVEYGEYSSQIADAERNAVKMGYTDDEMTKALALLTTMTGSASKAIQDQTLVMDLARFKQMDLASAAQMVAKVEEGKLGIVARTLPFLNAQMTKEEALAALRKAVSGQAEEYSLTAAGATDRLNASYDQLQETIGFAVLPVVTDLTNETSDLLDGFEKLPTAVKSGTVDIAVYGGGLALTLVTAAKLKTALTELGIAKVVGENLAKVGTNLAELGGTSAGLGITALVGIPVAAIAGAYAVGELNKASAEAYHQSILAGEGYSVAANGVDEYTAAIIRQRDGFPMMIAVHSQAANSVANLAYWQEHGVDASDRMAAGLYDTIQPCHDLNDATAGLTGSAAALQEASYGNRDALMAEAFGADTARSALQQKWDAEMAAEDAGAQSTLANLRVKEARHARDKAIDAEKKHSTEKTRDAVVKANADVTLAENAAKRAADKARLEELQNAVQFGKDIGKAINDLITYYSKVGDVQHALQLAASYGGYTGYLGATNQNRPHKARGGFNPGVAQDITWGEDGPEAIVPLSARYRDDALAVLPKVLGAVGGIGGSTVVYVTNKVTAYVASDYDADRLAERLARTQKTRARAQGARA